MSKFGAPLPDKVGYLEYAPNMKHYTGQQKNLGM